MDLSNVKGDAPLAVGSTFKLFVLEALRERVEQGSARWDDVVRLTDADKSLPSGKLQDWPTGSALTLETLASLMISESDNTATDTLIRFVGSEALESLSPRNVPFFSTRQLFVLKARRNVALLERFRMASNLVQKRALIAEADALPRPDYDGFGTDVRAPDLEWFLTTRELCEVIKKTSSLALTRINPGVAAKDDWKAVSYKGGSEGGVLNLTTHVVSRSGKRACISTTWNDEALLANERLQDLHAAILEGLKERLQ